MMKLAIAFLALGAALSAKTFTVTLFVPSIFAGTELKPGQYKMTVEGEKAVIRQGKEAVEATVKVETADRKFNSTTVRYQNGDGKYRVQEVRLGGTNMKVVFN